MACAAATATRSTCASPALGPGRHDLQLLLQLALRHLSDLLHLGRRELPDLRHALQRREEPVPARRGARRRAGQSTGYQARASAGGFLDGRDGTVGVRWRGTAYTASSEKMKVIDASISSFVSSTHAPSVTASSTDAYATTCASQVWRNRIVKVCKPTRHAVQGSALSEGGPGRTVAFSGILLYRAPLVSMMPPLMLYTIHWFGSVNIALIDGVTVDVVNCWISS